jgi:hypothetical protein
LFESNDMRRALVVSEFLWVWKAMGDGVSRDLLADIRVPQEPVSLVACDVLTGGANIIREHRLEQELK